MASITGIFDGAKENVRRGRASIGKDIAITQSYNDPGEKWDDNHYFDPGREQGDIPQMEESNKKAGGTVQIQSHTIHNVGNVWNLTVVDNDNDAGGWPNPFD